MNWTEERSDYLRNKFDEGLNAGECAESINARFEINITRCAVLGRLNRMGLHRGHGGPRSNSGRKPKSPPVARRARFVPPFVGEPPAPKAPPAPVSAPSEAYRCGLLDLTNDKCRFPVWPHGAMTDFLFCGAPEADLAKGVPYCPHCSRIAYRRPGESVAEPSRIA